MKNQTGVQIMRGAIIVVLLGLSIVFISCKKDNATVTTPAGVITDYHQTAVTQFVTVGETKLAYRVLGDKTGIPLVMVSPLGNAMDEWGSCYH
ncbi:MAG TPA: hypothetical protein VK668_05955 [Mucilaginibacter sp.]|nr:hypothetical protein [Mucilaginibacter sp.]